MEKLYYTQPYLKNTECTVTSVQKADRAVLCKTDRTIFYPECGGQPGDVGRLGQWKVNDTTKDTDGDSILHLDAQCPVKEGDRLNLELDWIHRYRYMVMHLCQHMISALLFSMFGIGTVAVHQGPDGLTIETDRSDIDEHVIEKLMERANQVIEENHVVRYLEVSHQEALDMKMRRSVKVAGDVRIVEIDGIDQIACGGVHASSTLEIRLVTFTGSTLIRDHRRLAFKCADDALSYLKSNSDVAVNLGRMLTCSVGELAGKIKADEEKLALSLRELSAMKREAALSKIRAESSNGVFSAVFEGSCDISAYLQAVKEISDGAVFVVCTSSEKTVWMAYFAGHYEGIGMNDIKQTVLDPINAKGGGRAPLFQGSALGCSLQALKDASLTFKSLMSAQAH